MLSWRYNFTDKILKSWQHCKQWGEGVKHAGAIPISSPEKWPWWSFLQLSNFWVLLPVCLTACVSWPSWLSRTMLVITDETQVKIMDQTATAQAELSLIQSFIISHHLNNQSATSWPLWSVGVAEIFHSLETDKRPSWLRYCASTATSALTTN